MAPLELAYSWQMQGEVQKAVYLFEKSFQDSDMLDLNPIVGLALRARTEFSGTPR